MSAERITSELLYDFFAIVIRNSPESSAGIKLMSLVEICVLSNKRGLSIKNKPFESGAGDENRVQAAVPLPFVALIDSGGKSIHGWIGVVGITANEERPKQIEVTLYAKNTGTISRSSASSDSSIYSRNGEPD